MKEIERIRETLSDFNKLKATGAGRLRDPRFAAFAEYGVARIGVLLLFCVFPFVLKNGYFQMTALRFHFFSLVSAIFFFLLFLLRVLYSRRPFPPVGKTLRERPFLLAFSVFCCAMFLSGALSVDRDLSFFGDKSRYLGILFYIAVLFCTLWISGSYVFTQTDLFFFQLAAGCACLLAVLQTAGFDVFALRRSLQTGQQLDFISTLGNIGVFSEYVCLLVPPAMFLFCFSGGGRKSVFLYCLSLLGFLSVMCADCDAGYLGFGAALFVLFCLVCRRNGSLTRFFLLVFGFGAVAAGFGMARRAASDAPACTAVTALVSGTVFPYAVLLLSAASIAFLLRRPPTDKARRRLFYAALTAAFLAAAGTAALIIHFTLSAPDAPLQGFAKYLRMDDRWGTYRGFIWSRCISLFRDAPPTRKLFGFGEETVGVLFTQSFYPEMQALGFLTNNAHNVYLQYLLTSGVTGLLTFLAMLATALISALGKKKPVYVQAMALSLFAFAAEGSVTITQPISTPFLFLIFAVIAAHSDPAGVPDVRQLLHTPAASGRQPSTAHNNTERDV